MLPWDELKRLIDQSQNVLLTTHVRPDGDALGSELAMAELLEQNGKRVAILNPSPTPDRYRFVDADGTRIHAIGPGAEPPFQPDLILVLDTGAWAQLPGLDSLLRTTSAAKVVIDHHKTQDDLGALQLVDSEASACGMLVYEAYKRYGGTVTATAANSLFLAISTDTGWMRHPNATSEVFAALAELVRLGAQPTAIYRALYETNSVGRLRLLGTMLSRIRLSLNGRLASAAVSLADISAAGAHPMDTEEFIAYPMSMTGVEAAVVLIEQKGGAATKVSFRSRCRLDCSRLAQRFGGGGHAAAAGATVALPLDDVVPAVLSAAEQALLQSES
jgi:phosphoesterase RecJ-like protein